MRTRIKICGITRPADAREAMEAGVDAIGLIFYPHSPRRINVGAAAEIAADVPAFLNVIGVFVDREVKEIEKVLLKVSISCLQFHGDELAEDCEQFGLPYIKTIRMKNDVIPERAAEAHPNARALLLDTYHSSKYGGTGETFFWEHGRNFKARSIIIAGGLTPTNVSEAMMLSGAYGIDVSTGVESEPGIKDSNKIRDLVAVVRAHDHVMTGEASECGQNL